MSRWLAKAAHLVRRFFGHVSARPLHPEEQRYVKEHLTKSCADLFWRQSDPDQRHAVTVARRVEVELPDDQDAIEAALLHDIGKWRPYVGPIQRSLATVLGLVRLPMTRPMWAYLDHGRRGSAELEAVNCGRLAVEFARLHPAPAPEEFDPHRWQVLLDADG